MPKGKYGLPRLTDAGPNVSYHNNKASKCSKQLCFDGHSKKEVFVSIRDAYAKFKPKIISELEDNNIPVEDIIISGSVVKGDFGCRDSAKIQKEVNELSEKAWRRFGDYDDKLVDGIEQIVENNSKPRVIWDKANSTADEIRPTIDDRVVRENIDVLLDDLLMAICSDIDMFIVFPDAAHQRAADGWRQLQQDLEYDKMIGRMQDSLKGNMIFIMSQSDESLQDSMDEPTISSVDGFDRIINKFY